MSGVRIMVKTFFLWICVLGFVVEGAPSLLSFQHNDQWDGRSNFWSEGRVVQTDLVAGVVQQRSSELVKFNESYNQWFTFYPQGVVLGNNYYLFVQIGKSTRVLTFTLSQTEPPKQTGFCRWPMSDMPYKIDADVINNRIIMYFGMTFGTFFSFFNVQNCSTSGQFQVSLNKAENNCFLAANTRLNRIALVNYDPKRILPTALTTVTYENTDKKACYLDGLVGSSPTPLLRFISNFAFAYATTNSM